MSVQLSLLHFRISHAVQRRSKKHVEYWNSAEYMNFYERKYSNIEAPLIYVFFLIHVFILKKRYHQNLYGYFWRFGPHIVLPLFGYTYLLTPFSGFHFEKLTGFKLLTNFPEFYGTRRFITAFTSARQLSLSWASSIQSYPHLPPPEDPSYCYPPINAWVWQVDSWSQVSPPKPCIRLSSPPYKLHAPPISFFSISSPE